MDTSSASAEPSSTRARGRVQVWFLSRSRRLWKQKHCGVKARGQAERNRVADGNKSREKWRTEVEQLRQQVRRCEQELATLKAQPMQAEAKNPPSDPSGPRDDSPLGTHGYGGHGAPGGRRRHGMSRCGRRCGCSKVPPRSGADQGRSPIRDDDPPVDAALGRRPDRAKRTRRGSMAGRSFGADRPEKCLRSSAFAQYAAAGWGRPWWPRTWC
mgnify:CR=1 FL=1